MIKYLDFKNSKLYRIDVTFRIMPRSLKPYKLMSIYTIDKNNNSSIIGAIICINYTDEQFIILLSLLLAYYNFSPTTITLTVLRTQSSTTRTRRGTCTMPCAAP